MDANSKSPSPKDWKTLSTREICQTKILSLRGITAQSARTGAVNEFILFDCPNWVNVIAVQPDGLLVAIRQYRFGSNRVELEIPGGCIDKTDKNPIDAAARELLEETGFKGENGRIIGKVCPNPALQGNICYTVKFTNAVKVSAPRQEDTESIELFSISDEELKSQVKEHAIEHALVLDALLFHWLDEKLF